MDWRRIPVLVDVVAQILEKLLHKMCGGRFVLATLDLDACWPC